MPIVPAKWQKFPMVRQGEEDYACAFCCVVAAAAHLYKRRKYPGKALLEQLPSRRTISLRAMSRGLDAEHIRALVRAANLNLHEDWDGTVEQMKDNDPDDYLWIATVWVDFVDPEGRFSTEKNQQHCVLVLEFLPDDDCFVIADPHPWNDLTRCVSTRELKKMMSLRSRLRVPWAARIAK